MKTSSSYGQYIALKIPTDGCVSVQEAGMVMDGKHMFSIEAWIRLNGMGEGISILKKDGVFNFGVSHGKLYFRFGDLDVFQTSSKIKVNSEMWHHIAVTYDKSCLFFYVNGECAGKIAVVLSVSDTPSSYEIGFNLDGYIRFLKVYDSCLNDGDVKDAMFTSATISPCAYFDFSCNPPVDRCRPSQRLDLMGGCRVCLLEPSLYLQSTAYAEPSLSEFINPGGKQIDAYTIQTSIFVTGNQSRQTIFVNGVHDMNAGMALYLRYEAEQKGYRLCSLRGADTNAENKLFSSSVIPTDEWVNVAARYDGQSSRIYINGILDAQEDNVGPILLPMTQGHLLVGGMLESGKTIGLNTMQGYIQRIDIWERALSADEIAEYADNPPFIDSEGLTDSFDFTSEPFRSTKLDIPISMNDLARFKERVTAVPENISEPIFFHREAIKANPELVSREREKLDIASLEKQVESLCTPEKLGSIENISRIIGRNVSDSDMAQMKDVLTRINEGKQDGLLAVTHYMEGVDYVIVAHYRSGSEAIARCRVDEIDDCVLRLIELLFILIGGAVSALFGIKTKLPQKAIDFIRLEILSLASVKAIISKGETLEGSDVYDLLHTLYVNGKLKPLLRLIVDLGFWSLIRFLAKAVLTFMGVGWADTIATLVATAVTFTLKFIDYVKHCIPLPSVTLESITFNHDTTRNDISALNIRKNRNTSVSRPEWMNAGNINEPVAYAIHRMNTVQGVQIKARFRMSFISPLTIRLRANAGVGNPLGDMGEIAVILFPGISREVSFYINPANIGNLAIGRIPDLEWYWDYKDPISGVWKNIEVTSHDVYFLKDIPTHPWNQNSLENPLWPWSDFLEISSQWLPAIGVAQNATLAPFFTEGINACGMQYSGWRFYFDADFNLTSFINDYIRNHNRKMIECSECAALMKLSCSLWGGEDLSVICFFNNSGVVTSVLQAIGSLQWKKYDWNYHVIATDGNVPTNQGDNVYDCCLHLDASNDPWSAAIAHIPVLPGVVTPPLIAPMTLGPFTQPTINPPYNVITHYLDRLFDRSNRSEITFNLWSLNDIK